MTRTPPAPIGPADVIVVGRLALAAGQWYPAHSHGEHQLVWAARGAVGVRTGDGTFVLPTSLALWVPAGVEHATGAVDALDLRGIYLAPERCPVTWTEPTVVAVSPLLRELLEHLASPGAAGRAEAEALAVQLLEPVRTATVRVPWPRDDRARAVADALDADPADQRTLAAWGRTVGASARTLARIWLAETGTSFARWRTQLRLQAALPRLVAGVPVAVVARAVGYETPSAFVAAFRRTTGVTPGSYFARS
ncbi:AraC family transcriptional regulator [Pseudonocardia sp. CA-107938]|uniref:AraC family transcriptional regulator n=1 Tax=Pseudonocardia sp. CA-107938 TaxID=3240021 RepID=UPI003D918A2A